MPIHQLASQILILPILSFNHDRTLLLLPSLRYLLSPQSSPSHPPKSLQPPETIPPPRSILYFITFTPHLSSSSTSSSFIPLQPYCHPSPSTISLSTTPSLSSPRPSTIPTATNFLNTLFSPVKWDNLFCEPLCRPLLFHQYPQKQVGKFSRLVTVKPMLKHYQS